MKTAGAGSLTTLPIDSPDESRLLAQRGEEILGYALTTLLNTFSLKRAIKRIATFGLSRATSEAILRHIECDASLRKDLAEQFLGRAKIAALGCALAVGLAFVPAIPNIYIGMMVGGDIYCALSLMAWKRYSKTPLR